MSAVALKHSTFLWLELHLRTRKVCSSHSRDENRAIIRLFHCLSCFTYLFKCLKEMTGTHSDRLPEQDVQGGVSVD